MKRFEKCKRVLATLLVALMVLQQTSIMTLAEELQVEAQAVQEEKAVEQETKPETSAPETIKQTEAPTEAPKPTEAPTEAPKPTEAPTEAPAPETQAPETQAPETQAPETQATEAPATEAPVTEAPATEAPATEAPVTEAPATEAPVTEAPVTEAPETEAPVTEAPETEAPVTEAPETEAPATEAPETETEIKETETETESETETEAPETNRFTASFANGKADVTLSEAISEKAQFIVKQKSEDSAYFDDALNVVGPWLDSRDLTILDAAVYDMHFEEDGKEIAVNQKANVNMQFASPILTMEPETGIQTQVYVLHIVNGNVEDAGSVTQNGAGAVTAATIHTNGFSPFVFVKAASGEPVVIPDGPIDLSKALHNAAISQVTYGGKTEAFDPNKQYPRDAKFTFKLEYAFAENNKPTVSGVQQATYQLPACLSVVEASGTIDCPGYAGKAGTYEIKNGVVTFTYEPEFLTKNPSDIRGDFFFTGAVSKSESENKDQVTIDFGGSGTTTPITIKFEEGKVTGDKIYTLNADGTIDFTIRLKVTEKDVKNLVLTDTQGSNLEFANPPEFRLDGELLNPGQYTVSGNQMTLNLGDRTRGEYTLTYKAKVKDSNIKDGDPNKNSANWTWTGGSGSKDTTVQITESIVNKNGAISNGEITWTVIYVPGNLSPAAGKTFTDTLGADQEYTGNYEVYYDSNGSQWWVGGHQIASGALSDITAADGKSFSYTFPSDQTTNRGAYKLVYKTKITKDMSDIKDTVTFTNKIGGDGKEAGGKVEVKPGEKPKPDIVKKSVVTDSENRKATWTITVTPPEGKTVKNLVIKDELQDFYNWKGKYEGTVTIKEAGSTLTEGTDYTVAKTVGGNGVNPTMTLVFSKEISGILEITYTSDYTDSGSYSGWVGNKIHSSYTIDDEDNEEDDSASGEIKNTDFVLDKSGTLSGGIAKWEIIINDLQNWKRTDLPESTKTITDTLPEYMAYVDGSAKCMLYKENEEKNPEETAITASFDPSTRKLTMTVPALTGKVRAVITYDTKITTLPTGSGNGVTVDGDRISFTNSVTVGKKTESATVTMTSKELHKVGKAVSGLKNVVEYVIDVNYEAMDLLPDSDVLVLEDVLDENLTLDITSITVTDRDTGEAVSFKRSFSTLNDGKTKMVLTIPDSRALRVVYRATLVTADKEDGKTYQVSNSATLKGQAEKSTEIKTEVKYQKSDATVSGGSDSVSIQKVNEDGKSLKGATFVVKAVNPETLEDNPAYETMTATSDSNGMVTFEKLHYNTLYYYEETTAPTGYSRDTERHYFIIKNIKDDGKKKEYEELKGKADAKNITLNEFTGGNTVIFENKKETTSRMVRKEWIQEDDIPANASVQVQLFGKVKDGAETQYGDTATLNAENGWRYTWENLPITDSNGNEITYSVKEVGESDGKVTISGNKFAVEIEDLGKEGFKIVNKKLIDISGSKTWDDNNNQDGKRPSEIKIHLFADGAELTDKVQTVTASNGWSWKWENLPKYAEGKEIVYTIAEDAVENYMTIVDGYNVTNMHIPVTINISGGKDWNDANNQDGKRPGSITIRLYADGTELTDKVQTVTAADNWEWTFTDLPKYANGREINYTITEDAVAGYTTSVRGYNVTNTHTPETIDISGSKTWNDADNQDGKRPREIKIHLFADGTELTDKVQTVTASNGWSWKWENLPKYANGKVINYTITEDAVANYTTSVSGYNVTNTYTPEVVRVVIRKVWNDADNQDGKRPAEIKVDLKKKVGNRWNAPNELVQTITLNEGNGWKVEINNLPKYTDGKTNIYNWSEHTDGLPKGYYFSAIVTEGEITTLTNSYKPEETSVSVQKVWNDDGNRDGIRPDSITVTLYAEAEGVAKHEVKQVTLNEANNWTATVSGLAKYVRVKQGDEEYSKLYTYTWEEENVPAGYTLTTAVDDSADTVKTIFTNTHIPEKVEASVRKVWNDNKNQDGKRPTDIIVKLYGKAGEAAEEEILKTTLNEANNWTFTKTDLPKFKDGVAYTYYWTEETQLPDYTVEAAQENSGNSFVTTLTNTHTPEKTPATVEKVWDDADDNDGKRPEKITVVLKKKNGQTETTIGSYELNADNGWRVIETELDVYTNGVANEYIWEESGLPDGYSLESTDVNGTVTTLTNKYAPGKVSASVKKEWNDANNQDGIRPTSLDVVLKKNGKVYKTVTLNSENHWSYTVADLEDYTDGVKNIYTWEEVSVPEGYTSSSSTEESMTTLTNTHIPETVNATVYKVWDDNNNQDGIRPLELTVTLWRRAKQLETDTPSAGAAVEVKTVTLNQANNWSAEETGLAKYTAGVENEYFWTEESIAGYVLTSGSTMNSDNAYITTLTNKHITEKTSATVEKRWRDNDNQDQKRPESITVILKKSVNGLIGTVDTYTLTAGADGSWKKTVDNLPKYENGTEIQYFWEESQEGLNGYQPLPSETANNMTLLVNAYTPEETSVSVQKVWNDDGNRDRIRPESITVTLYAEADGVAKHKVDEAVLNETNLWAATKSGLAKNVNGKPYTYTWEEENVPDGYTLTTGYDSEDTSKTILTNTHIPEKVEASVEKVWNDNNNQDGKRPTDITVKLYGKAGEAAAEEILETTLNEANNWKYTKTDLPKFKNGAAYTYYWTEETQLPGYTVEAAQQNGEKSFVTTLTNTHAPEKTSATVEKRWRDNDNQDRKRPESITVILKKSVNGLIGTVDTYTLTAGEDGSWKKTVDNLPKYENGTEIQYFWEESQEGLNGYQPLPSETANNMTLLVNAYTPEETSVSVQKVWNDDGNRDRIRPESITVTLYAEADGVAKHKVDEAVLNETNLWAATKSGLAKNVNGKPYTYTWEEENVPDGYTLTTGYDSEDTSKTILTNTHTPETVNATVVKAWDDADNQDGKRPQDLTVTLMKNETVVVQTVTLDAANSWTAKVENLAKNENGTPIRYSWVEGTMPEGYSLESAAVTDEKNSDDVVIGTITTLTNTYAPGKVSASVKKVWDDENNQDGIRPETLRVNLLKNGQATDQFVILSEENRWSATLDNLDEYTDGTLNEYTWSEALPNGYTVTVSDPDEVGTTTLTNTHTPATIGASVEKIWDDNDNQDGKRPEKLLVTLMRRIREQAVPISLDDADTNPAEEVKTVELTAAHNWKASVSNLPKYKDGQMYEYFWTEKEGNIPNGYKLTNEVTYNILSPGEGVTGFITRLTNSHKPQKINATVKKVWDDNNNQDGKRAPELTVDLMRNGTEVAGTVTLNEENNWTGTVENLDKYTGGVKNGYTWVEKNLPDGYSLTKTEDQTAEATAETAETIITTLTNSYTPGKVEASVLKVWNDGENQDGIRPDEITVILVKNDEPTTQSVTLSEANHWTAAITGLDEYTDGTLNEYTWKEAEVPDGYTLTNTKKEGRLTTLTNTHTPEVVNATIRKAWNDAENQDGVRPTEIKVDLKKNGQFMQTVLLNTKNGWEETVENLPKYTNGRENTYSWSEQTDGLPEGYELTGDVTEGEVTTLTNTRVPDTVSVGVRKIWNDAENQDGIRPSELRVDLLKNGELTDRYVILNEENGWTAMITDLPKNTAVAEPNVYTWSEELPDGYTVTVSDPDEMGITTLTNTHTPATIEASVEKTWDDNEDQDGKRPEKLFVTLMRRIREQAVAMSLEDADDADTNPAEEVKTVELTAANGWKASVSDLPKYSDGQMYEYFWTEKEGNIPDGYELTNEVTYDILSPGEGVTGFITTLTNSHKPQKINATVKKVWDDNDNQDGKRPTELVVTLKRTAKDATADDTAVTVETVTLNEANNWSETVTDLPKYTDGIENEYFWEEENVPEGYELTKNVTEGIITTLTNTHVPEKVDAVIQKEWDDADNQDGKRPTELKAELRRNGTEVVETVTLNAENNWTATVDGLDKYTDGEVNVYNWVEKDLPEGYSLIDTAITSKEATKETAEAVITTLTNAYTPGKVSASVLKVWDDADNQDGKRPETLKVNLLKNGEITDQSVVLSEENNWQATITDLDEYTDGTLNTYTWEEDAVPEGYELTVDETESYFTTLKNSHVPETIMVEGNKIWSDEGYEASRPESITVTLFADGVEKESKEVKPDANGTWTWKFEDLQKYHDGEEILYTVTEDPVTGYVTDIKQNEDGTYTITNTITSVKINKVDIADGKLVEGAYLQILDQDGNVVDEWVSTKESHEVTGLMTGETYTLHEMTAPDGYDLTEDTTFVLKEDGTIDADKTTAASKDGVLLVEDTKTEQTDKAIEVTKKLGTIFGNTLSAEDATYYVALYADEACTKRISNVKALEFKNASSSTVTFENLKEDTTYYVGECTADGTSYKAGTTEDGVRYTVNFGDGNRVTIEKADGTKEVHFDNVFLTIPDGYNVDASLKIVKKVVDVDGNAKETNETFYAGLFADKECTTLSDAVSKNIIELNMNGSAETNVEITVPLYPAGTVVNLYVAEVDKDGNLVTNDDKFAYDVEVTNGEVTLDAQNDTAEVTITNSETSEEESESESETESESESETETEKQTETESKGKKPTKQTTTAAKTGDNTPIGALAGALAVSAAVIVVYIRRRRKNEE